MSVTKPGRAALESERDFLLQSLADLEREHAAGDLSDEDFATLRASYVERAADSLRQLEGLEDEPDAPGIATSAPAATAWSRFRRLLGRRKVRRFLVIGATICLLGAVGLTAARVAGVRLPGESLSGSVNLSEAAVIHDDLVTASAEANAGQPQTAVLLYEDVLAKDPDESEALTYWGWLTRLSGIDQHSSAAIRDGDASIAKATRVAPSYPDGWGLLGVAELQDDADPARAVVDFGHCLADHPSASLLASVAPSARLAYDKVDKVLPAKFAKALTTS